MGTIYKALMLTFLFFVLGVCILSFLSPSAEGNSGWNIDLFCQYGGRGHDVPCPVPFVVGGERIILFMNVTYNQAPVMDVLVALQVDNPQGSPFLVATLVTNASGIATMNFTLNENSYPIFPSKWNCTATTSPAQDSVSDSMPFQVIPRLPVGGISLSIPASVPRSYIGVIFIEILMASALIATSKVRKGQTRHVHTV